ncbi:hypothetical protein QYF36_001137 [Acer negundo]|nr:hypothetical protein QYF36_001137 [Acer negundo]
MSALFMRQVSLCFFSAPMLRPALWVRNLSGLAPEEKKESSASVIKQDGSTWKWNCFRLWETYKADISIDVNKHHNPVKYMDKFAYLTVQALKVPTTLFFQVFHHFNIAYYYKI